MHVLFLCGHRYIFHILLEYFVKHKQYHNIHQHNVYDVDILINPKNILKNQIDYNEKKKSNLHNENLDMLELYNDNRQ